MAESNKKWYVLRAVSGKEAKVKEYIETDVKLRGLTDKVTQVLIPTEKVVQVRNGKRIVKEKSYLPGYVLVEAELVGDIAFTLLDVTGNDHQRLKTEDCRGNLHITLENLLQFKPFCLAMRPCKLDAALALPFCR